MANAVLVNTELDLIKSNFLERLKDELTTLEVGDDNTTPLESDTSIGNLVDSTTFDDIDEAISDQITFNAKFGITAFVGDTIRETTLKNGSGIKTHSLSVEALKGADQIFWVSTTVKITAINKT